MEPQSTADPPTSAPGRSQTKRYVYAGLSVSAALLVAYTVGYFRGREVFSAPAQAASLAHSVCSKELAISKDFALKLEARRSLNQSRDALDSRNFGTAEQHLTHAARLIVQSHPSGPELELSRAIGEFRLVAMENLGAQHERIQNFVEQFDRLVPPSHAVGEK